MLPVLIQNILKYMPIVAFQGLQAGRDHARRSSPPSSPGTRSARASPRSDTPVQAKNATNTDAHGVA
ncbi:hypothetical protein GSI_07576 [Ganoderma sinense ZZ0214-1]|uniref:Uncharacterized protein n=1 Tax=Ganoderma sinense ZZ0214-1 TaxID=1077348 RepID=A0A2G8S9F4_9APHY|nr:hypothetical protein GSI_07576 [Ganoderma sinense ZZ0214-1]